MDTKNRFKKTQARALTDINEANLVVAEIGHLQSKINEIEAKVKAQILALQTEAKKELDKLLQTQNNAVTTLFAFATKNRAVLTANSKTITCGAGVFGWRNNTPTVTLTLTEAQVIEFLNTPQYKKYLRIKETLDKEKMLKERPLVAGVRYEQREEFYVKPKNIPGRSPTLTRAIDK